MLETMDNTLAEVLTEALETMAFVSPMPPEPQAPHPRKAVLVSISFGGPTCGSVELAADAALGMTMAANVLGTQPTDPDAASRAADALKELVNVTCGLLLARRDAQQPGDKRYHMGVPQFRAMQPGEWEQFIQRPGVMVLDAEGALLALALAEGEAK